MRPRGRQISVQKFWFMNPKMEKYRTQECISKVELHLSGLTGTDGYPNLQKNPDNWIFL